VFFYNRKGLHFYAGFMMQDIIEVGHRAKLLSSASPNPPQLIKEGFLGVLLLVFFSIASSGNFSADARNYYVSNTPKPNLSLYFPYSSKRVTSLLYSSKYHSAKAKQLPA